MKDEPSSDVHMHKVCSKLSQKVGLFGRLRSSVPNKMLRIVYQTCIQPAIDYCITVWGKVQIFHTCAARIITGNRDYIYEDCLFSKAARVAERYGNARIFYGHAYA